MTAMKIYFIHQEGQQLGPFSIEELKQEKISRNTPVWCEGMDGWESAITVEDLKMLFNSTPPPFNNSKQTTSPSLKKEQPSKATDLTEEQPEKKNNTWFYVSFVILICVSIASFTYQQIQINGLESEVIEKTDSIKELKRISTGQAQALSEITQEQEMRANVEKRESQKQQLNVLNVKLQQAKDKLAKLNEDEFTGSPEEKIELIQTQEGEVRSLESQIKQINQEMYGAQ